MVWVLGGLACGKERQSRNDWSCGLCWKHAPQAVAMQHAASNKSQAFTVLKAEDRKAKKRGFCFAYAALGGALPAEPRLLPLDTTIGKLRQSASYPGRLLSDTLTMNY